MIDVYVCEDNDRFLEAVCHTIENYIQARPSLNMRLVMATGNPYRLLDEVKRRASGGLYFLDVDLGKKEINGFTLASEIKKYDVEETLVFITGRVSDAHLVFEHATRAIDYILKEKPEEMAKRIEACMDQAYSRWWARSAGERKMFIYDDGSRRVVVERDEIMYFETSGKNDNKVIINLDNHRIDLRATLQGIEGKVDGFFRAHRSCLVNVRNLVEINLPMNKVYFVDGSRCTIAAGRAKVLAKFVGARVRVVL